MFFESDYIAFKNNENHVAVVDEETLLPIVVLDNEHKSVKRVAGDLQSDLEKVTGKSPDILTELPEEPAVIVGTVSNASLIERLGIDTADLQGKWESFAIQTVLLPGHVSESIVILGSDKRGAIFGVYDFTEKMGVSPWYWWMDVPVKQHDAIYVKKGKVSQGDPSVQYRGFFLNDEGPSLMTWVRTHFPDFTYEFYEKIFELTLRLKGNYHWPAMWDSTFYEDDELNIVTADLYGVIIGTSHHEPMNRPHGDWKTHKKGPWDYAENEMYLKKFWTDGIERSKPYETIINLGMRGDGDEPMGGDLTFKEKIKLMEKIIKDQREIMQDTMDVSIEEVPQMWALYKEVKEYYDSGMDVPEDITLLWGDDNFGNIRRLPTKAERQRKGGAGIYYHFDYVGGPRSYKWVNTVPIQKTYEQMHKAYEYEAKKLWIVNVGDLKPMEYQTEFFMKLAWQEEAFNPGNLEVYAQEWADYTFGKEHGESVAKIIRDYVKFNGRMKPEVINLVDQYSWDNEYEAERILKEFEETVELAETVFNTIPAEYKDAFYQVAYYPAKASYTVLKLQLLANLSKKYKKQGRRATNVIAQEAERLFEADKQLTYEYNKRVAHGKWDHMMDQLHIGYTYWQQPDELIMPGTATLNDAERTDGDWDIELVDSNKTDSYSRKPITIDVYNKGNELISLEVASDNDWLVIEQEQLDISMQERLVIDIDWTKIGHGENIQGSVKLKDAASNERVIDVFVDNPKEKLSGGFVPVDGKIAIEAEDFSEKRETTGHHWEVIPDYGRTKSSLAISPVEREQNLLSDEAPRLSYDIVLPEKGKADIKVITAPSLPFDPDKGVRLGISVDEKDITVVSPGDLSQNGEHDSKDWERSVIYNCHEYKLEGIELAEGKHTVHLTLIDPQVVIQKLVVNLGGVKPTYLGPMPTPHADRLNQFEPYIPIKKIDFASLPGLVTPNDAKVYAEESGIYSVDSESLDALYLDESKKLLNEDKTVFIEKGWHTLRVENDVLIDLVKPLPLTVKPVVTHIKNELDVQMLLHYMGDASLLVKTEVSVKAKLPDINKAAAKKWLKTDEQQLKDFIFDIPKSDALSVKIDITVEGHTYTLSIPLYE
ncbi:Glycosyl hydrolase family 67 N-terminus [Alkalibacterium putridalgicola]|uniref:Glycosyl hydrolase family 67 N-terminus n=1 Tax=Alkalibacterium putridalgicola TaxID=426703 RepID=A0A1H7R9V4_9LACT|nr:glycosyl hydrolase 115 family protein [Alkalibacterium putridalgicola]GEK88841.1 hypothetical protein APU01nite_08800 [Alkalibacterium putridalgicola]SEL57046.1 Glycosyl hydrolase family 67 N-terminus [Alkalibacterium putridalgicola]